jgi:integrase
MTKRAHGEGSLLKRKGCRYWYAQWYEDGRVYRESTKQHVKQKALVVLRQKMGKSESGETPISELKKIKYGELRSALLDSYLDKENKSLETRADGTETIVGLKQLDDFFGFKKKSGKDNGSPGVSIIRMNKDAASRFKRKRKAEGAGPAMINRSLACMRRMLRIAHEDGKITRVPKIPFLKEPSARRGFLPLEKFEALSAALPSHLRPLITFLYFCGVRVGEALQIEWPQVDLKRRLIYLEEEQTKNEEPRVVPLPSVLVMMLEEKEPKIGIVFSGTNLRTEWARACTAVGLGTMEKVKSDNHVWHRYNGLIVHDLRRSAVRNLRLAGVPESVAMKITGHKTRAVFERYNIVSPDDVTAAMHALESATLKGRKFSAKLVPKSRTNYRKPALGA